MPWTVDDTAARATFDANKHNKVVAAGMRKYYEWRTLINENIHPITAAAQVSDMHYEQLAGQHKGLFTVRLTQTDRVVFTVDGDSLDVTVSRIGGHFP